MPPALPHLIVREGPEKGREIVVPEAGARVGRAHENDIVLNDPALSRFQCRLFFTNGILQILDLGSTNQTLVNHKPASEQALRPGDDILIGEMTLRVLSDRLDGVPPPPVPAPAPVPRPATVTLLKPAAPPQAAGKDSIAAEASVDLGFKKPRHEEENGESAGSARRHAPAWLWAVAVVALLALGLAAVVMFSGPGKGGPKPVVPGQDKPERALALRLEKVEGSANNIFRYFLTLENGRLYVEIDDLKADRKVTKEKQVSPTILKDVAESLRKEDFFGLNDKYEGVPGEFHDRKELQLTLGRQSKGVLVLNRIEPGTFKAVRETIEEFAESELGLEALSLPPDELKKRGLDAFQLGQKLYGERNTPKHDNLWNAIKAFSEVEIYLESVEPKPDYFADAVAMAETSKRELKQRLDDLDFRAQQNIKLREWEEAARTLKIILQTVPDKTNEHYAKAERELLSVERNLGPRR